MKTEDAAEVSVDVSTFEDVDPSCHFCEHVTLLGSHEPCASCGGWNRFKHICEDKRSAMIEYLVANHSRAKQLTCDYCTERIKCEFAYDLYNTDGDCIAEK